MPRATNTANRKIAFTKTTIGKLPAPTKSRTYYYDDRQASLAVCVMPSGKRTFYLCRWLNGTSHRIRIGEFPSVSVEQARRRVRKLNAELDDGRDPISERRAIRQELRLSEAFEHYLENYAKHHTRRWDERERLFKKYVEHFHSRRMSSITTAELTALHTRLGKKNGKYQANRVVQMLSTVYYHAAQMGWRGDNPAKPVRLFKEHSRERFLSPEEIKRFLQATADEPDELFRDFFVLLLFTGARRANVQSMAWKAIDLSRGLWRISSAQSKSGDAMIVVLPPPAIQILEHRAANANGSEWVFPADSKPGHLVEPRKAWARVLKRAELNDFRMHDLRRTLGSWLASAGASLPLIGKTLGHRTHAATSIYARLDIDPVRTALTATTAAMLSASGMGIEHITGENDK